MSEQTAAKEVKSTVRRVAEAHAGPGRRGRGRRKGGLWPLVFFFGSLKMAMALFVVLIVACAIGTIYESRFDTQIARYYIYEAPWFTFWLILLCVTLACAALTRYPWKKHHTGFVVTHLGIIILLIGAMIGKHFGMEGFIRFHIGEEPRRHMSMQEMALNFWGEDGELYLTEFPVALNPPTEQRPRYVPLDPSRSFSVATAFDRAFTRIFKRPPGEPTLVFDRFSENLVEEITIEPDPGSGNAGVKITMSSEMMGAGAEPLEVVLMEQPANRSFHDLSGLAQISLVGEIDRELAVRHGGLPVMQVKAAGEGQMEYHITSPGGEPVEGVLAAGESVETGWADWTLVLEKAYPEAEYRREVYESGNGDGSRGLTGVRGWLALDEERRGEPQWFIAGETETAEADGRQVRFGFGNRRMELPFRVHLEDFEVPRDEGTDNPAAFISTLVFHDPATGETVRDTAGMNHPAMYPQGWHRAVTGFTYKFSQADWDPSDPTFSGIQVLYDPGWLLKWIGSLTIIAGIYTIFYLRPYRSRRPEDSVDEALRKKKHQ